MTDELGTASIRKRPGMYVGPLNNGDGLLNMVLNAVGAAVNEVRAGVAERVRVAVNADGSCTVQDDGRGLPTSFNMKYGMSDAEFLVSDLHAMEHTGLPGPYLESCRVTTNALSSSFELRVWRDGSEHLIRFHRGIPEGPMKVVGSARARRGTEMTFTPDEMIFPDVVIDGPRLAQSLRELAVKYAVAIDFEDYRNP